MTSWLMVLPAIDKAQLAGFLDTCRLPRENILIVDNSGGSPIQWGLKPPWRGRPAHRARRNLGVSASWNLGVRAVLAERLDWLVIASTSLRFGEPGGLDFIEGLGRCGDEGSACSLYGWHLVALARSTLETVGEFDEGFFAYSEETCMLYRMGLAGIASPRENGRPHCWIDVDAEYGRQAAALVDGLVPEVSLQASADYYEMKWGGPQGAETFTTPFGDPRISIKGTLQNNYDGFGGG